MIPDFLAGIPSRYSHGLLHFLVIFRASNDASEGATHLSLRIQGSCTSIWIENSIGNRNFAGPLACDIRGGNCKCIRIKCLSQCSGFPRL